MIVIIKQCAFTIILICFLIIKGSSIEIGSYQGIQHPFLKINRYPFGGHYPPIYSGNYQGGYPGPHGCPICDSSVYSYCSHKLVHDSCCCRGSNYQDDYFECNGFINCDFLYANTCQESDLIATCCCEDGYRSYNSLHRRFFNKK